MTVVKTEDQLGYVLPDVSPQEYFQAATKILEDCRQHFPAILPYLLEPSNLLALAGMRAESPYVDFGPEKSDADVLANSAEFAELLRRHDLVLIREDRPYLPPADTPPGYTLVNKQALDDLHLVYIRLGAFLLGRPIGLDRLNYADWYNENLAHLAQAMEQGEFPEEWLRDWWAPHNVLFGALLGYPSVAICSSCRADATFKITGEAPNITTVTFDYPKNNGTRVCYDVLKVDVGAVKIEQSRQLWQAFFDETYDTWGGRISKPT